MARDPDSPVTEAPEAPDTAEAFAEALAGAEGSRYVLRLYVGGCTPRSMTAIANLKKTCEEHLAGRYDLEVIDVYEQPELARDAQIVAVPTLIRQLPAPLRRLVGDLADKQRVLVGLDLRSRQAE